MRRGSAGWTCLGGGDRGQRYGDFGQCWRRRRLTGSSAGATPLLSLGSKSCANARPCLWPAVGARHGAQCHQWIDVSARPVHAGCRTEYWLGRGRQVLDGVWGNQDPHRIWSQHVHHPLQPLGTVLHRTHHLGGFGPTLIGLDIRLPRKAHHTMSQTRESAFQRRGDGRQAQWLRDEADAPRFRHRSRVRRRRSQRAAVHRRASGGRGSGAAYRLAVARAHHAHRSGA